jgi:hypothetical protein
MQQPALTLANCNDETAVDSNIENEGLFATYQVKGTS